MRSKTSKLGSALFVFVIMALSRTARVAAAQMRKPGAPSRVDSMVPNAEQPSDGTSAQKSLIGLLQANSSTETSVSQTQDPQTSGPEFRIVDVSATLRVVDDGIFGDEVTTIPVQGTCTVGAPCPTSQVAFTASACADNSIFGIVEFTCIRGDDRSDVIVFARLILHQSSSCSANNEYATSVCSWLTHPGSSDAGSNCVTIDDSSNVVELSDITFTNSPLEPSPLNPGDEPGLSECSTFDKTLGRSEESSDSRHALVVAVLRVVDHDTFTSDDAREFIVHMDCYTSETCPTTGGAAFATRCVDRGAAAVFAIQCQWNADQAVGVSAKIWVVKGCVSGSAEGWATDHASDASECGGRPLVAAGEYVGVKSIAEAPWCEQSDSLPNHAQVLEMHVINYGVDSSTAERNGACADASSGKTGRPGKENAVVIAVIASVAVLSQVGFGWM